MRATRIVNLLTGIFFLGAAHAQMAKDSAAGSSIALSLEGMAGISMGTDMVAMNVGGPNLLLHIGRHWRTGLAAFPSFFIRNGKAGARLGVGYRVDYKNMVLFTSFFHFDRNDVWVGTVGIGYKFHRKNK